MRLPPLSSRLVTAAEMSALDRAAIEGRGIPSLTLMERAGRESAKAVASWWRVAGKTKPRGDAPLGPVLVLCGRGNNGGDGLVVARHLKAAGYVVRAVVAAEETALTGDALAVYQAAAKARVPVTFLPHERAWSEGSEIARAAREACLLVDALLGTGSSGAPRGAVAAAIEIANASGTPIVSIDIPSGVEASTGHVESPAIDASLTVTLAIPKLGLALEPGRSHAGPVQVVDIGIPPDLVRDARPRFLAAEGAWARSLLPRRPPGAHKGSVGRVLLVGGSAGMIGAVAMAGVSVLRSGAGYCVAVVPESCVDVLEARVSEVVKRGAPETPRRTLARAGLEAILGEAMRADVVAIGPGLSREPETEALVRELVARVEAPIVLDADGLNAFEGMPLRRAHGPLVVTPHFGEAARLTGASIGAVEHDPVGWARRFCEDSGAIVCLKCVPMIVVAHGEPAIVNGTGNPGMATAGAGDVLTGTIAGLLAQGMHPIEGAALGCYVHGLAGDIAASRMGKRGMIAGDVRDALPSALVALESGALDGA